MKEGNKHWIYAFCSQSLDSRPGSTVSSLEHRYGTLSSARTSNMFRSNRNQGRSLVFQERTEMQNLKDLMAHEAKSLLPFGIKKKLTFFRM